MNTQPGDDPGAGSIGVPAPQAGNGGGGTRLSRWASRPEAVAATYISILAGLFVLPSSFPLALLTTAGSSLVLGWVLRLYRNRQRDRAAGTREGAQPDGDADQADRGDDQAVDGQRE